MNLPIQPPFAPMEALLVDRIPTNSGWQFEPKWDGFRCLIFRDGQEVYLQSKAGQPLARYFPELTSLIRDLPVKRFVVDGEIAIPVDDRFSFNELLQRIHPAATRVEKLASEHPSVFIAFDLLVGPSKEPLFKQPLRERRAELERFAAANLVSTDSIRLSPTTQDPAVALEWLDSAGGDLDGIIAKRLDLEYRSGDRTGMQKIKPKRTADCVVGGFRYASGKQAVGSLLLGLYDEAGLLHHVGFCSALKTDERKALLPKLLPLIEPPGFTGHAPGGPSRWSAGRDTAWEPLRPELVLEVGYDHYTGGRFRHGTKFVRWRPDKAPKQCGLEQVERPGSGAFTVLSEFGRRSIQRRG